MKTVMVTVVVMRQVTITKLTWKIINIINNNNNDDDNDDFDDNNNT